MQLKEDTKESRGAAGFSDVGPQTLAARDLIPNSTYCLFLPVHDGFQLLKVAKFYLQLLHLSLHQKGHQGLDLPLLHSCQVLGMKHRGCSVTLGTGRGSEGGNPPASAILFYFWQETGN